MVADDVERTLAHLMVHVGGDAAVTTKVLRAIMLQTGGRMYTAGRSYEIKAKHLGGGAHRLTLEGMK